MIKKTAFKVLDNWKHIFYELSNEQAGVLIKAIFQYADNNEIELEEHVLRVAFAPIKAELDQEKEKQIHIRKVRSEAGKKGGVNSGKSRAKGITHSKSEKKEPVFVPPSLKEVAEYIQDKKYKLDASAFYGYYKSTGWVVGKGKKKMKDWKYAVDYWNRTQKTKVDHKLTMENEDYNKGFKTAQL